MSSEQATQNNAQETAANSGPVPQPDHVANDANANVTNPIPETTNLMPQAVAHEKEMKLELVQKLATAYGIRKVLDDHGVWQPLGGMILRTLHDDDSPQDLMDDTYQFWNTEMHNYDNVEEMSLREVLEVRARLPGIGIKLEESMIRELWTIFLEMVQCDKDRYLNLAINRGVMRFMEDRGATGRRRTESPGDDDSTAGPP